MRHTPGPWIIGTVTKYYRYISNPHAGWYDFARVVTRVKPNPAPSDEGIANLNLILAAPDLLGALENFTEAVRTAYIGTQEDEQLNHSALAHSWPDLVVAFHQAVRVIAQAKGSKC